MKVIALLTVLAVWSLELSGAIPKSSVGGPMTIAVVFILAMIAVGLYEAWSKKRGVLGWIVNIVVAFIGGFVAVSMVGDIIMGAMMSLLQIEGSLASTRHPMLYISEAGMAILAVFGAWISLQGVNRFRDRPAVDAAGNKPAN